MNDSRPKVRVFSCQGSAQLVTALAAGATRAAGEPDHDYRDVLVIHDLCCPGQQDREFAQCIERLATALSTWERIVYLSPADVRDLRHGSTTVPNKLGISKTDELFLGQNPLPLNHLLAAAFPDAPRFCFGDSLGVNFSPAYFALPQRPSLRAWWKKTRNRIRDFVLRSRIDVNRPLSYTDHYLVLANRFDEIVPHHVTVAPNIAAQLFAGIGQLLDATSPWAEALVGLESDTGPTSVLITANFSESGKMSQDAELAAYEELLACETDGTLIVKPHPRDSAEKVARLRSRLTRFRKLLVLDDPASFYIPFEAIFTRFLRDLPKPPRMYCVSSSCLTLEMLYGVPCQLGFGIDSVRRYFPPELIEQRLTHESDLRAVIAFIRESWRGALYSAKSPSSGCSAAA